MGLDAGSRSELDLPGSSVPASPTSGANSRAVRSVRIRCMGECRSCEYLPVSRWGFESRVFRGLRPDSKELSPIVQFLASKMSLWLIRAIDEVSATAWNALSFPRCGSGAAGDHDYRGTQQALTTIEGDGAFAFWGRASFRSSLAIGPCAFKAPLRFRPVSPVPSAWHDNARSYRPEASSPCKGSSCQHRTV